MGLIMLNNEQIVEMNEQIRTASEAQSKFFTNVSHEFKTPLTLILAPMEELEKEKNYEGLNGIIKLMACAIDRDFSNTLTEGFSYSSMKSHHR